MLGMLGMLGVMGVREEVERMGIMGRNGTLHGMQWLLLIVAKISLRKLLT